MGYSLTENLSCKFLRKKVLFLLPLLFVGVQLKLRISVRSFKNPLLSIYFQLTHYPQI